MRYTCKQMADYSGKPLLEKLGIKRGMTVYFGNPPDNYFGILGELPEGVFRAKKLNRPVDFMHCFYTEKAKLAEDIIKFKQYLEINGILWVSWPKKTAIKAYKIKTDITEHTLRDILLPINLVDTKVVAIDDIWTGFKFTWRKN